MDALGATDEAHRGQSCTILVQGILPGLHHFRMTREAKVVVGAEVEDAGLLPLHADGDGLLAGDDALTLPCASLPDALQLPLQDVPALGLGMALARPHTPAQALTPWQRSGGGSDRSQ